VKVTQSEMFEDTVVVVHQKLEPMLQKIVRLTSYVENVQNWLAEYRQESQKKELQGTEKLENFIMENMRLKEQIATLEDLNLVITEERNKIVKEKLDIMIQIEAMESRIIEENLLERNKLIVQLENQKFINRGLLNEIELLKQQMKEEEQVKFVFKSC
jgi:hypothetical protein